LVSGDGEHALSYPEMHTNALYEQQDQQRHYSACHVTYMRNLLCHIYKSDIAFNTRAKHLAKLSPVHHIPTQRPLNPTADLSYSNEGVRWPCAKQLSRARGPV